MKKLFTILCGVLLTFGLMAQQTSAGTFYMALGNAYNPMGEGINGNGLSMFTNSSGMSLGSEWVTGITIDGDDDDDSGDDYWGENDEQISLGNFNISGQFGIFAAPGLLTGLGLEYSSISSSEGYEVDADGDGFDDEFSSSSSASSFAVSPFIKYYINLGSNAIFLNTSYTFGSINSKSEWEWDYTSSPDYDDDDEGEPYRTSRLEFGTGMAFFLTDNIALEPSVNLAFNTYTQEQEIQVGSDPFTGMPIYDDQDYAVSTVAFYLKIAASMYF